MTFGCNILILFIFIFQLDNFISEHSEDILEQSAESIRTIVVANIRWQQANAQSSLQWLADKAQNIPYNI